MSGDALIEDFRPDAYLRPTPGSLKAEKDATLSKKAPSVTPLKMP